MKTLGQCADEAIKLHETKYKESKVYHVTAESIQGDKKVSVVLRADHFSVPQVYYVRR